MVLRLIIAEDSLLVREGVAKLLNEQDDVEVVALCADYDELMAAVEDTEADVVLTDIRMPPTGTDEGIRAASELRVSHPDLGVVVLSQYAEPEYALALLESGSEGRAYLLKERVSDPDQLLGAVRDVARGGSVVDPKVVEGLVTARSRSRRSPSSTSPRGSTRCWPRSPRAGTTPRWPPPWACRTGPSRSTSTPSSPSWASARSPTSTVG